MTTGSIMFQGTGSDVGKSVLTAAMCRIFARAGYDLAPFKSQNMALNSHITKKGKEIGRAQAVQAEAAMINPTVDMNPILLKPNEDNNSQVIFRGQPYKNMTAKEYFAHHDKAYSIIENSLNNLHDEYEIIVMEGGGSPAEINLRENDLVNMSVAEIRDTPVILVADIDKGGVFASIVGTLELLQPEERERIKGIVINKFRGDVTRFNSGVEFIEEYTGKPVLGVIPYAQEINLPDEDSIYQASYGENDFDRESNLDIAVIYLPHISNFTDFDYFSHEPGVRIRYVKDKNKLGNPDLIIIPGSKNTIEDLNYIQKTGLVKTIIREHENDTPIIGICGGYQMLGREIYDPLHIETKRERVEGIGLLDLKTVLSSEKITTQVEAEDLGRLPFWQGMEYDALKGYEIHQGRTELDSNLEYLFKIKRNEIESKIYDGAINTEKTVWGTYLHDIFKNDEFRRSLINYLREQKGLNPINDEIRSAREEREKNYNQFADLVKNNLDMEKIYEIVFD